MTDIIPEYTILDILTYSLLSLPQPMTPKDCKGKNVETSKPLRTWKEWRSLRVVYIKLILEVLKQTQNTVFAL